MMPCVRLLAEGERNDAPIKADSSALEPEVLKIRKHLTDSLAFPADEWIIGFILDAQVIPALQLIQASRQDFLRHRQILRLRI